MAAPNEIKKVLLKDIVIPAGTMFTTAPIKTERTGGDHYECLVGLSDNTCGSFVYDIDPEMHSELDEYFTDLK